MDYPSGSDDEDSDFVLEQPKETEENDNVIDSDMELSSSDSDVSSISGNVQEDRGRYCYRLQRFHKDAFYATYLPEWEKAKKSSHLNDDLGYYGVLFNAVKTFIHTCSMCVPNKVTPKRTKMQPLKMILSKKVGSRFQMDLIEMPPYQDYCYILHVVDHLSKYGYVRPIKARSSLEQTSHWDKKTTINFI
jgi:hypothetical protein